jgi:hypothetical protein
LSSLDVIRWGGVAAMLGGVVFVVNGLLGLINKHAQYLDVIFVVALLLVIVGLVGFHTLQKGNYGRIGRAGFYTVVIATLAQILGLVVLILGSAVLEWLIPIGSLAVLVGFVLYGAATLQAKVLPRWCGIGFIIGLPVTIALGEVWGFVVFGLLWLALGYVLWSKRGTAAEQPSRVS